MATRIALRSLARRFLELNDEVAQLDDLIAPLVEELAPGLIKLHGIGIENAGQLLVTAGDNPERLRSEAGFAMLCGAAPLPASSGKTQRHRLNRGGDRNANSALHFGCGNAVAEAVNGLYKAEVIRKNGPWRSLEQVELATAGWVDWWNHRRLHSAIRDIPPAEFEANYHQQRAAAEAA